MPSRRTLVAALALGASSLALGLLFGSPGDIDALDMDETRSRIRDAMLSTDRLEQAGLLVPIFRTMGPGNVEALAQAFESTFASGGGGLPLELFVERWTRFDPQGSRSRISGWPADKRREAWPALLRAWAQSDPQAAVDALEEIPDAALRRRALPALIEGWSDSDDAGVWRHLSEIPDERQRSDLATLAMQRRMPRIGADALLRELEGISDEPPTEVFKRDLLVSATTLLLRRDLDRAVALSEAKRDSVYGAEIQRRVASYWASQDGPAALAWLRAQPVGSRRDDALARAYRSWLRSEPPAASAWLSQGIADRDIAPIVIAHAVVLAREDPETAIAWLKNVPDAELRRRSQLEIEKIWQRRDPEAAALWRERVGIQEETPAPSPPADD